MPYTFTPGQGPTQAAAQHGLTPQQFLQYNPQYAADPNSPNANDAFGLSGNVPLGGSYNIGPQLVVGSGPANNEFNQHSGDLTNMLGQLNGTTPNAPGGGDTPTLENTNDAYTQMLDRIAATSSASTKALIGTIQASRANRGNTIDRQYDDYKRGLQLLGIQHNAAQSSPDLLMGHIQQAENEHQSKIQALDVETNKALMDAEKAQAEGDLNTLKEKMAHVKELKQEKEDALKKIAENLENETKIADIEAAQYYDKLQSLSPADKEEFLKAVAKKFKISLGALTRSLVTEKERREKEALEMEDKKSIIANRKASGSGGSGGGYTPVELRKLRAKGINPADTKTADNFLYNGVEPTGEDEAFSFDDTYFKENFNTKQLFNLALNLGIPRKKNLSRQNEIKSLLEQMPDIINDLRSAGYSDTEIQDYFTNQTQ